MKKKITTLFLLALGATTYAQQPGVGIGTPLPSQSAMLDVNATDKGVLIPRVKLSTLTGKSLTTFGLVGTGEQGVLVYNTEVGDGFIEGFYYWEGAATGKWEAVTSSSKLETVIKDTKETLQKEITEKITEITKIPGNPGDPTDLSYMVAFKPLQPIKPGDPIPAKSKETLQYLIPHEEKDGDGKVTKITYTKHEIGFDELVSGAQTVTDINRFVGDGTKIEAKDIKVDLEDPKNKVKGKIFYTYTNEDKVTQFIDVTSDFLETIKENKEIRKEIVSVITEVGTGGDGDGGVKPIDPTDPDKSKAWGNVYYGPENGKDGPAVLYSIDKDGNKHYIDISQNLINEITNNPEVVKKIKETVTVTVTEDGKPVDTNDVIDGKIVQKVSLNNQEVVKGNGTLSYNSEFNADGIAVPATFDRLLSVKIFNSAGVLVMTNVTNVNHDKVGNKLKFNFGSGSMYSPLTAATGYQVILEYVSTVDATK
ncbi:hypothetical protein Q2490_07660 [Myroides odoratimimus]|uniref:hypothetical protein n=1 Tax=Myroides odoratimimus TaxID=76832 RepID=UPI0026E05654|nr:hypothetical protein [Myroides odoratimimus]MDO5857159.1 hypothetical protein [Myroides odoratimimus]